MKATVFNAIDLNTLDVELYIILLDVLERMNRTM